MQHADPLADPDVADALLASTSVLMATWVALGRCASTAHGGERELVASRVVENLALVDSRAAALAPPVRSSVRRALAQWREIAARPPAPPPVAEPSGLAARMH